MSPIVHLAGNHLGDDGFQQLIKVLHTLPNLHILDVSSNGLTYTGLAALADALSSTDNQEPSLQVVFYVLPGKTSFRTFSTFTKIYISYNQSN